MGNEYWNLVNKMTELMQVRGVIKKYGEYLNKACAGIRVVGWVFRPNL
jgi:N-glycosylase/DNA lyase